MNIKEEILNFMSTRPDAVGIIGYGSGVNPQKGQEKRKPQIDLIIIVNNLKKWHAENIKLNKRDYSLTSRLFFRFGKYKWLKSGAHICYMTYIPFKEQEYKIGTIELKDFLNDLNNWDTFYMAGRMQKPILVAKSNKDIDKAIQFNRESGVLATEILAGEGEMDISEFYMQLAGLSYVGDTRMGIAENPDKVRNIVLGSYDFYNKIYGSMLNIKKDKVVVSKDYEIEKLPCELKKCLSGSINLKKEAVLRFLTEKNKNHSMSQTIKGIFTTGPIKAIKYALAKLKRKRGK